MHHKKFRAPFRLQQTQLHPEGKDIDDTKGFAKIKVGGAQGYRIDY